MICTEEMKNAQVLFANAVIKEFGNDPSVLPNLLVFRTAQKMPGDVEINLHSSNGNWSVYKVNDFYVAVHTFADEFSQMIDIKDKVLMRYLDIPV